MVLIDNIVPGQVVEVLWKGEVRRAKVHYCGRLNGEKGDWVGLELLSGLLNGYSDGRFAGRTYFACEDGRGVFTTSNMIRFVRSERRLFDRYQTLGETEVEETLFRSSKCRDTTLTPQASDKTAVVSRQYCERLFSNPMGFRTAKQTRFAQFCGNQVGSAPLRKHIETQKSMATEVQRDASAYQARRQREKQHFITPPTISRTYLPYTLQRNEINDHKRAAFSCRDGHHTPSVRLTYDFQDYSH